ncbi:uncharacterized protein LOC129905451 [Episyrphus balteatus]|uniref:uncharacterized protein LOC129905451 n=1 Tax=Episyrphus balteatus TaxID=286459 RepID=UPI002486AF5D|nr:uncharacterized protein LOC129905451 [Episyrphus balteatus]
MFEQALLRRILDGITEVVCALQQLERPTENWDDWLILHVTEKLDPATIREWKSSLQSPNSIPTYLQLEKFLKNRLQGLDAMAACSGSRVQVPDTSASFSRANPKTPNQKQTPFQPVRSHQANSNQCPKCSAKHVLMFCPDFRNQTPTQRLTFVMKERLCKNCLKADHVQQQCTSEFTCLRCHQKHHTMLHDSIQSQKPNISTNHMQTNNTCSGAKNHW